MSRLLKLGAAVGLVVVGLVVGAQLGQAPVAQSASAGSPSGGFALARPAFAQTVARTFLDDEAGISVYLKLDQTIDLAKVRGLYRVIEDETETYLIGTIHLSGYDTAWWPHVWITKDGWVIAYYTKTEPTSRLMHWPAYTGTGITSTTLREILLAVGKAIEIDTSVVDAELRYYHWQHPEATRLLVVAGEGTIKYRFPETLTVYEGSWSFSANRVGPYDHGFSVNGRRVGSWGGGTYIHVGRLPSNALSPDNDHAGTASAPGWGQGSIAAAIAFVYR